MAFSNGKQIALALTPKFSGFFSVLGSTWIVVEVLTTSSKRHNVYNRLLCAMSFFDILTSLSMFLSTWPIPKGTEGVVWAIGNYQTCVAQGFFQQAGFISPCYNGCLAVYYMLVVKYGISEKTIKRRVEPILHILPISIGIVTASMGIHFDMYNNANLWCWIASYPTGCQDSNQGNGIDENDDESEECIRGEDAWIYRWAFYFAPLWFVIAFVTIVMTMVYLTVRRREKEAHQNAKPKCDSTSSQKNGKNNSKIRKSSIVIPRELLDKIHPSNAFDTSVNNLNEKKQGEPDTTEDEANHVLETIETFTTAYHQNVENNQFGSRAVFKQSMYYTCAFYLTYLFATINRLFQNLHHETYFTIIWLHSMFIPLQGLFNVLIYRYAYVFRMKQRYPHLSKWELFRMAWRWSFLGPAKNLSKDKQCESPNLLSNAPLPNPALFSVSESNERKEDTKASSQDGSEPENLTTNQTVEDLNLPDDHYAFEVIKMDMMMSYSEFPNMLADDDAIMVSTRFPSLILADSFGIQGMSGELQVPIPESSPATPDDFPIMPIYDA